MFVSDQMSEWSELARTGELSLRVSEVSSLAGEDFKSAANFSKYASKWMQIGGRPPLELLDLCEHHHK